MVDPIAFVGPDQTQQGFTKSNILRYYVTLLRWQVKMLTLTMKNKLPQWSCRLKNKLLFQSFKFGSL